MVTKTALRSLQTKKRANPAYAFRPSDEIWKILTDAQKITKRTKSSLITECVEFGLPKFIARIKAQRR